MIAVEEYGPIRALNHGIPFLKVLAPRLTVRCFAVDGLLVDAGLSYHAAAVAAFAAEARVEQVALTHHHEDHSGNAAHLQGRGLPVRASERTRAWMAAGFGVRLYEWLVWGEARPAALAPLPARIETPRFRFEVIEAPGHCEDQVVLFEPSQGWLFSGDAFLGERIKLFRGDEDFAATVASLERLVALDFDALWCAHRPVPTGGREALRQKLARLRELEGRVRELAARGWGLGAITREVLGREDPVMALLSWGDLTKRNLVRSILAGPVPRADRPPAP